MSTASGITGASPAPTAPPEDSRSAIELNNPKPVPRPGTWISAAIVAVLGAMLLNSLITNDKFHWDTVWFFLREVRVIAAVGWTLLLTFMAMGIGIVLAVTTAIMRQSSNPVLRVMSLVYLWFFRGTPIYTQLVFWGALSALYQHLSLGVPFGPELLTFKTTTVFTPFVAAVLGLGINEGAYLSEIVRSGLNSVDKGQSEAARALGMGKGWTRASPRRPAPWAWARGRSCGASSSPRQCASSCRPRATRRSPCSRPPPWCWPCPSPWI